MHKPRIRLDFRNTWRALPAAAAIALLTPALARTAAAEPLLPDLFAWENEQRSYMYNGFFDTTSIANKVLYRFTGALPNIGTGPLEVREVTHPNGTQDVYQRIYDSEGGVAEVLIGSFPDAAPVSPFHLWLPGIAQYNLRAVTEGGGVGPVVSSNDKTSMALVDGASYNTSLPGAPPAAVYDSIMDELLGVSVGWADIYRFNLPGQWVDATGLPSGQYWLEVVANPYQLIQEADETNNTTRVLVDLVIPAPMIWPGDYNQDGTVDAADYTEWRDTLSQNVSPGTGADGDGNGTIGMADYEVWRQRFGETAPGAGSGSAVVPEPAGPVPALIASCCLLSRRRRYE